MFHYGPGEFLRASTRIIFPSDEAFLTFGEELYPALAREGTFVKDVQLLTKDGELFWCHASVGLLDKADPSQGIVAIIENVTEARRISAEILQAKEQAEQAREQLGAAFDVIESSIHYASRIQRSVLPETAVVESILSDCFVLWEPRDVVGGDIYWVRKWGAGHLVILADCTGHGVPGAFVTLIATGALSRAQEAIPAGQVGQLLAYMHGFVQATLGQHGTEGESDDGLELGACYLDDAGRSVRFSGARFSLFIARDGDIVEELKGDKRGMGYRGVPLGEPYSEIDLSRSPGMRLYMSSDGLIDQIGGERHRAFGKSRFRELLNRHPDRSMSEQKKLLADALAEFQGSEPRRDDVSVIGFRLS
jgi:serine phosphatase RsbU (regulator of sigma subunit)